MQLVDFDGQRLVMIESQCQGFYFCPWLDTIVQLDMSNLYSAVVFRELGNDKKKIRKFRIELNRVRSQHTHKFALTFLMERPLLVSTGATPVPRFPAYLIRLMACCHMVSARPSMYLLNPKRFSKSVSKWLDCLRKNGVHLHD